MTNPNHFRHMPVYNANGAFLFNTNSAFVFSANGATYLSPGHRPGYRTTPKPQALKGRPKSQRMEVAP